MTRNSTTRTVTYRLPNDDRERRVVATNETWNDSVARSYAAHDVLSRGDDLPEDVLDIEIVDISDADEMGRDEFDQMVFDVLCDENGRDVANWTMDNARDMSGLGPADVARENGLPLSEDSLGEVIDDVELGYLYHLESVGGDEADIQEYRLRAEIGVRNPTDNVARALAAEGVEYLLLELDARAEKASGNPAAPATAREVADEAGIDTFRSDDVAQMFRAMVNETYRSGDVDIVAWAHRLADADDHFGAFARRLVEDVEARAEAA